jgi:hypothetical protein
MVKCFAAILLTFILTLGGWTSFNSAAASPLQAAAQWPGSSKATDVSSRRHHGPSHHRHIDRLYHRPSYYDRPYLYRPYPYASPAPFVFGLGFGP